jgi:predicted transcriptional regulator
MFSTSLRVRVTKETKKAFERIAKRRGVKEAHVQREALEQYAKAELAKEAA